jgi:peptidoglycan/LPS O-acetylase OafA/YrhL
MGVLRVLLAFLVVYGHCGSPFGGVGLSAQHAVQAFYMISGFYMTLVLREKYSGEGSAGIRSFYLNRWLRLYPAYLAIVAMTLAVAVAGTVFPRLQLPPQAYLADWLEKGVLDWGTVGTMAVSQFTMLGLDAFNLLTLTDQGSVAVTSGATTDQYPLWRLMLIPQSWSLSIELYFYALAPFIVTRSLRLAIIVAVASFGVRLLLWRYGGLQVDPWSYRFFPSELMFFLAGTVAYHVYARSTELRSLRSATRIALYAGMAVLIATSIWIGRGEEPASPKSLIALIFMVGVFFAIPALFRHTKQNSADRLIGELSYPVYISHVLIVWILGAGNYHVGKLGFVVVAAITLAVSYALYRWIDVPIDEYRHRKLDPARMARFDQGGGLAGVAAPRS